MMLWHFLLRIPPVFLDQKKKRKKRRHIEIWYASHKSVINLYGRPLDDGTKPKSFVSFSETAGPCLKCMITTSLWVTLFYTKILQLVFILSRATNKYTYMDCPMHRFRFCTNTFFFSSLSLCLEYIVVIFRSEICFFSVNWLRVRVREGEKK